MQFDNWEGFRELESSVARENYSQLNNSQSKSELSDSNSVHTKKSSPQIIGNYPNTNTDAVLNLLFINYLIRIIIIIEANYISLTSIQACKVHVIFFSLSCSNSIFWAMYSPLLKPKLFWGIYLQPTIIKCIFISWKCFPFL